MQNQVSWGWRSPVWLCEIQFYTCIAPTLRFFLGPAVQTSPNDLEENPERLFWPVLPGSVKPSPSKALLLILICLIREFSPWNLSLFFYYFIFPTLNRYPWEEILALRHLLVEIHYTFAFSLPKFRFFNLLFYYDSFILASFPDL